MYGNKKVLSFKKIDIRLLLGLLLGIVLLYKILPMEQFTKIFEDLALGKENTTSLGKVSDLKIHCNDLDDVDECLQSYKKSGSGQPVLLWLGNSQVHAINQFKPGEETAAPELHRKFQVTSEYFLTLSQPNANLQEHFLLFTYLLNRLPIKKLVLPVFFDDMREDGVRTSLVDVFKDQKTIEALRDTKIGRILIENHGNQDAANKDMVALQDTLQERSERGLNSMLEEAWLLWAARPTLRGELFGGLYLLRNWVFGINASSSRKIIPGNYARNIDALFAILKVAALREVQVLIYIPPLRNDVKVPYDIHEYTSFKSEIASIAQENYIRFVDLENVVPAKFWGTKNSTTIGKGQELDFMHFQAAGHRLLATAIYNELKTQGSSQ